MKIFQLHPKGDKANMAKTVREEIVDALRDGFGKDRVSTKEYDDATDVHVEGYDEPITVWRNDIDVPDCFPDGVKAGIRLDIQALLSNL
jgi:hypothetical protein